MYKQLITTLLLFLFAIVTIQCSAQAEEGADDESTEDRILSAFLFNNGFVNTEGFHWKGTASINSCIGTTPDASVFCGTLIPDGLVIQQQNFNENVRLTLTSVQGSLLGAKFLLIAPHFNAIPFPYEFGMSGTQTQSVSPQDVEIGGMILFENSVIFNENTGYTVGIANYQTNRINDTQVGTFNATLSHASVNGNAILEYNITLTKEL